MAYIFIYSSKGISLRKNDVLSTIFTSYLKTKYIFESGANKESFFHLQIQQPATQTTQNTINIIAMFLPNQ